MCQIVPKLYLSEKYKIIGKRLRKANAETNRVDNPSVRGSLVSTKVVDVWIRTSRLVSTDPGSWLA